MSKFNTPQKWEKNYETCPNRRCTSSICELSLGKVWIKKNENFWSYNLHKLGTPGKMFKFNTSKKWEKIYEKCTKWKVHIFNMWAIIRQSLNKKEWKLLELQITQTWYPKVFRMDRRTDWRPDGQSGPSTRPAFAKVTQVKKQTRGAGYKSRDWLA